jgi:hypothetical protein
MIACPGGLPSDRALLTGPDRPSRKYQARVQRQIIRGHWQYPPNFTVALRASRVKSFPIYNEALESLRFRFAWCTEKYFVPEDMPIMKTSPPLEALYKNER